MTLDTLVKEENNGQEAKDTGLNGPVSDKPGFYERHGKRALDLAILAAVAVPAAIAVGIAAYAIKRDHEKNGREDGSVVFTQDRVVRNYGNGDYKTEPILKLSTMIPNAGSEGNVEAARVEASQIALDRAGVPYDPNSNSDELFDLLKEHNLYSNGNDSDHSRFFDQLGVVDPRITEPGRWIRKYKIDELLNLISVANGDMSMVGQRPVPLEEIKEGLSKGAPDVPLNTRAGVAGDSQVDGAGYSIVDRMNSDDEYSSNVTLRNDLRILTRTAFTVIGQLDTYDATIDSIKATRGKIRETRKQLLSYMSMNF